jgi:predicted transcriptional regulator
MTEFSTNVTVGLGVGRFGVRFRNLTQNANLSENGQRHKQGQFMDIPVTINLPNDLYRRAERFAHLANRDLSSILTDTLTHSFPLISSQSNELPSISELSDQQVMALTYLEMEPAQDTRLSELLDKQQSGTLNPHEPQELDTLMQTYREGLLRKATALAEAVKRGLMESLNS